MPQRPMPAAVEVSYKLRTQKMQELRLGVTLDKPTEDSDSVLVNIQNEGDVDIAFDPANEKYDFFYRSINENNFGSVVAINRTTIRSTLSGALNATSTSFTITPPANVNSFVVGDVIEIENELMVLLTWDSGTGAATVEERGAHGTIAASHADATEVAKMKYTVPHNAITLSGFLDSAIPLAPTSLILRNVVGALGNGIEFEIGLPASQIKTLKRYQVQLSTVLWPEDAENVTGLRTITHTGTDGAVTQGGTKLTTTVNLSTAAPGDIIYTHEGINLVTGAITFPLAFTISAVNDLGGGVWEIVVAGDDTFKLRNGASGVGGTVNFYVAEGWRVPNNPSTWVHGTQPLLLSSAGTGDPDRSTVQMITLFTSETVYARCRLRNYEGWGPWRFWDGSTGSTSRAAAVTFTPPQMKGPAIEDGAITALHQSRGTIPATVNINMVAVDNDTVSWSAGDVAWADGTTESISATGSPKTLSAPGIHYVYKIIGNSTLQFTTTFSVAVGNDRVYLGQVITTSTSGEFVTIFLFGDVSGPVFSAAVGAFGKLSALSADIGDITAGTLTGTLIRTSASGRRVEIAATDDITFFEASGAAIGRISEVSTRLEIVSISRNISLIASGTGLKIDFLVDSVNKLRMTGSGGANTSAFNHAIDMQGFNIQNVGNLELDSITKDGAGDILFNDNLDMGGLSIVNVGDIELDSLTKDVSGDIQVNSRIDMVGNNIRNIGDVECDSITRDGTGNLVIDVGVGVLSMGASAQIELKSAGTTRFQVAAATVTCFENLAMGGKDISSVNELRLSSFIEGGEIADPAAPAANKGRHYFKDNGSGKTQLVVRFPTGAVQVVATEP